MKSIARKCFPSWSATTLFLLRLILGVVFIYAGLLKAWALPEFAGNLAGFRLIPEALIPPLAAYVPFLEVCVGLALILGFPYSGALLVSGSLIAAFVAFVASALWRGLDVNCGCFGSQDASLEGALVRNFCLGLLWLVLAASFLRKQLKHPAGSFENG